MTRVNRSKDCGNSPKSKLAEEIPIAMERHDGQFLSAVLDEDAMWELTAGTILKRGDILLLLANQHDMPTIISTDRVVTHGKSGVGKSAIPRKCRAAFQ